MPNREASAWHGLVPSRSTPHRALRAPRLAEQRRVTVWIPAADALTCPRDDDVPGPRHRGRSRGSPASPAPTIATRRREPHLGAREDRPPRRGRRDSRPSTRGSDDHGWPSAYLGPSSPICDISLRRPGFLPPGGSAGDCPLSLAESAPPLGAASVPSPVAPRRLGTCHLPRVSADVVVTRDSKVGRSRRVPSRLSPDRPHRHAASRIRAVRSRKPRALCRLASRCRAAPVPASRPSSLVPRPAETGEGATRRPRAAGCGRAVYEQSRPDTRRGRAKSPSVPDRPAVYARVSIPGCRAP